MSKPTQTKEELKIRLKELEKEYELANRGIELGRIKTNMAMISGLVTLFVALAAFLVAGSGFLSGNHLVIIFGMLIAALVIYYSFVFGRSAKVRMEISKTKKLLEISSGEKVRK